MIILSYFNNYSSDF